MRPFCKTLEYALIFCMHAFSYLFLKIQSRHGGIELSCLPFVIILVWFCGFVVFVTNCLIVLLTEKNKYKRHQYKYFISPVFFFLSRASIGP